MDQDAERATVVASPKVATDSLKTAIESAGRYTATPVDVQVTVIRGFDAGPTVFLTAAIHGDELIAVGLPASSVPWISK